MTTPDAAARRPFDAVLCDIDNVIRFYDHTELERLERAAGLAPGATMRAAFAPGMDTRLLLGEVTKRQWSDTVAEALTAQVPAESARTLALALAKAPTRVDGRVVELLLRARAHLPVVLVSNATLDLEDELALLGLTQFTDALINSARVGAAKPDSRIYTLAAAHAGVPADRCLFVDDSRENVEAAVALGMTGVHYGRLSDLGDRLAFLPG